MLTLSSLGLMTLLACSAAAGMVGGLWAGRRRATTQSSGEDYWYGFQDGYDQGFMHGENHAHRPDLPIGCYF